MVASDNLLPSRLSLFLIISLTSYALACVQFTPVKRIYTRIDPPGNVYQLIQGPRSNFKIGGETLSPSILGGGAQNTFLTNSL